MEMESSNYFKAFIRVVKSIALKDPDNYMGFDTVEVIKEPLIIAKDKDHVKSILLNKYPQFFANGKVYEKETKNDKAQFFYVVIFPLYQHEINLINEGKWTCDYCGHIHENKYISRPVTSRKFEGKIFCGNDYKTGNDIVETTDCYEKWKREVAFKNSDLPDDLNYINVDSLNYIYKVTEKLTGKCYIGKTRNAPFFRWWNHLTHSNSPFGIYLRDSKLSNWTFEVLEELPSNMPDSDIFKIESDYIVKFDSINNGFNSVISNKKAIAVSNKDNSLTLFSNMTTKTLSSGIRIDDNRSINCGVSISNQNNPMYYLWYNLAKNEFAFTQKDNDNVFYMENVSEYINALADIIQSVAEANEFVGETKTNENKNV